MKIKPTYRAGVAAFALTANLPLSADVVPNPLFSDNAVLQQGTEVPIWGTADEGEEVTVEIAGQEVSTTAKDGKWKVFLQPLKAGRRMRMKISGKNKIRIENILAGEVWVCSGQSNMEWPFRRSANAKEEQGEADYPEIRMFTLKHNPSITPVEEADGSWVVCSPKTVREYSGVGYYFARDLHKNLRVPVGMINSTWGGTVAQAWTSIDGLGSSPELKNHFEKAERLANDDAADAKAKRNTPTALFNGMIVPIKQYGIKGVIWYQGESNSRWARQYRTLFPALIADWREKWQQGTFPFLYVQIAPYKGQPPEIREAQFLTLAKTENTAMTVITDSGDPENIHPAKKEPVGHRLSLAARALAYGEDIEYSGPLYDSMKSWSDSVEIFFTHTGSGLMADGGELRGFTIAGSDGDFKPAEAEIRGDKIVVSSEEVRKPKAVRYGWSNVPDVNLYNKEGLPASPFRTDVD